MACNAMLDALSRDATGDATGDTAWGRALALLKELRRKKLVDVISFNCSISACEVAAKWEVLGKVWEV